MTVAAWVLGGGGLLGRSLGAALRERGAALFEPPARLVWDDAAAFARAVERDLAAFARGTQFAARWTIAWAAGRGIMASAADEMKHETALLSALAQAAQRVPELRARPGALFFASSAGGVYAGSRDETITERSQPRPVSAYGLEKLAQERVVAEWAAAMGGGVSALVGRISTLYGPGQASGKRQGLISHIARSVLRHRPVNIFVPLDTMRDYLYAEDAGRDIVAGLEALAASPGVVTKIVASEHPTTIAQIVATFRQLVRRTPGIVTSANPLGRHYAHRLCLRSVVLPEARARRRTTLLVGISEVLARERVALAAGAG